jgi:hypothetical protein
LRKMEAQIGLKLNVNHEESDDASLMTIQTLNSSDDMARSFLIHNNNRPPISKNLLIDCCSLEATSFLNWQPSSQHGCESQRLSFFCCVDASKNRFLCRLCLFWASGKQNNYLLSSQQAAIHGTPIFFLNEFVFAGLHLQNPRICSILHSAKLAVLFR